MVQRKREGQAHKGEETRSNMLLAILILIAVGLGYYVWRTSTKGLPLFPNKVPRVTEISTTPTPKVSPTPSKLKQGKETYSITQGPAEKGPDITQAVIDPLEPQKGQKVTMTISVNSTKPADSVTIELETDTMKKSYPLTLVSGTNLDGQWQATWTVEDTLLYQYVAKIEARSGSELSDFVLTIRNRPIDWGQQ